MQGIIHSQVYKTKDYAQFKFNTGVNRDVNLNHVKKYKTSVKTFGDFGAEFPIVIDENNIIIDGQHRFTARKELGLTIYYIQSTELDATKLGGINDAIAKWKPEDFMRAAKDSPYVKWIRNEIMPHIHSKLASVGNLLQAFVLSKNIILSGTKEDNKYISLVRRTPLYIYYAKVLALKVSDLTNAKLDAKHIHRLALKLSKFGVHEDLIIKGTYNEIMADLYQKNLIR